MPQFWQTAQERADASNGVWQTFNPTFKVGELTLALHQADAAALPVRNQEKVTRRASMMRQAMRAMPIWR